MLASSAPEIPTAELPPSVPPVRWHRGVIEGLRSLHVYRDLLYTFVWREVQIKYKQSVMGLLWAVFMPSIIVGAGVLVRYAFAMLAERPLDLSEVIGVTVKAVPWAFTVAAIRFSTSSLIGNAGLVTKVYFPRELFPVSAVLSQLVDFAVAAAVVAVLCAVAGVGLSVQLLWLPLLLAMLVVLCTGVGLLVAAGSLFFRDVKYVVEAVLTFAIFFTPVFYESSMFGERGRLLLLNPVAPILEGVYAVVLEQAPPELGPLAYSGAFSVFLFFLAFGLFKKLEPAFAESI